jgi:hypothetical protein
MQTTKVGTISFHRIFIWVSKWLTNENTAEVETSQLENCVPKATRSFENQNKLTRSFATPGVIIKHVEVCMKNLIRVLAIIPLQLGLVGCLPSEEQKSVSSELSNSSAPEIDMAVHDCSNLSADKLSYIDSLEQKLLNPSEPYQSVKLTARELGRIGCSRSGTSILFASKNLIKEFVPGDPESIHLYDSGDTLQELLGALATVKSTDPEVIGFLNEIASLGPVAAGGNLQSIQEIARYVLRTTFEHEYPINYLTREQEVYSMYCNGGFLLANGTTVAWLSLDQMIADILAAPNSPYLRAIALNPIPQCDGHSGHYRAETALSMLHYSKNEFYPFMEELLSTASKNSRMNEVAMQKLQSFDKDLALFRQHLLPFLTDEQKYIEDEYVRAWLLNALYMTCNMDGMLICANELQPVFENYEKDLYFLARHFASEGRKQMVLAKEVTVVPSQTLPAQ